MEAGDRDLLLVDDIHGKLGPDQQNRRKHSQDKNRSPEAMACRSEDYFPPEPKTADQQSGKDEIEDTPVHLIGDGGGQQRQEDQQRRQTPDS
jgi:hypothetical protein